MYVGESLQTSFTLKCRVSLHGMDMRLVEQDLRDMDSL